ncbi:Pyruvate kinase [Quillaja saponaria]|uniref:pyruvate kinase n=1 Tax=Quillaja saponaria TaxID=32244 RepID=A0AAD7LW09_QUISA|nr:Pyruvate kinase [Quillaja saponaria]
MATCTKSPFLTTAYPNQHKKFSLIFSGATSFLPPHLCDSGNNKVTLDALSAWVATNQGTSPSYAIQSADLLIYASPGRRRKTIHLSCRRHLTSRTIAFSLANENNEGERGSSYACEDNQVLIPSENDESNKNPNMESGASVLHAEAALSPPAGYWGNCETLLDKLKAVHLHVLASEQWNASRLKLCHRNYLVSATNLIHHLALKCLDVEQLREDLSSNGLLNLEAINSCVLPRLTAAILLLESAAGNRKRLEQQKSTNITMHTMRNKSISNKDLLLGQLQDDRNTHIMVTVGQEATESETLITDLLKAGTSIIRINCSHGDPCVWSEIIRRVKHSSQMLEKPCRILMDLAGPKLRTGKLMPGPCVIKISPKKNATGNVISPAQVWLSYKGAGPPPTHLSSDAVLFLDDKEFLSELDIGDTLRFCDTRGKNRTLKVSRKIHFFAGTGCMAECNKTAYVDSGTELDNKRKKCKFPIGRVVDIPASEQSIRLKVGDLLVISRDCSSEQYEPYCTTIDAHKVTCSSGLVFDSVKPGETIAFDDGKIWGVIQGNSISEIIVSITHTGPKGSKLGSHKSINIPESNIHVQGFTSKDYMDLEFVGAHADMVGVSFVQDVHDIVVLRQELEKRNLSNLGIVLKIETKNAFENLPLMLLEAMKSPNPLGVMIARGDLAVECGWERLASIQEEILSICGAAHVPVIWATQVLESLVRSGVPTRAEITDVARGKRTSCIMLNKGKNIVEAVSFLDTILVKSSKEMKAKLKPLLLSGHMI